MSDVKRYLDPAMYENEHGPWVRYDDYEYAERQAAALRAQVAGLSQLLKDVRYNIVGPDRITIQTRIEKALAEAAG